MGSNIEGSFGNPIKVEGFEGFEQVLINGFVRIKEKKHLFIGSPSEASSKGYNTISLGENFLRINTCWLSSSKISSYSIGEGETGYDYYLNIWNQAKNN